MLPYFKTIEEVKIFLKYVNGRCKTNLLVETKEAVDILDEILQLDGINEIHIGLNDLHLDMKLKFMFELLSNGTVEQLCKKIQKSKITYGFGGIARVGEGTLSTEAIIAEHYRLGSTCAILSRSFCNTSMVTDKKQIRELFFSGVKAIREFEKSLDDKDDNFYLNNQKFIKNKVEEIIKNI